MGDSDYNNYDRPTAPQQGIGPLPSVGTSPGGSQSVSPPPPAPTVVTPAFSEDAAVLTTDGLGKSEWPPKGVDFPTLGSSSQADAAALRGASEKMERDMEAGAPPHVLLEDAAYINALLAVAEAKNQMDETMLKAFDEMLEHARKMMERHKEWVQKVKLPEEQQIEAQQVKQSIEKIAQAAQQLKTQAQAKAPEPQ